MFKVIIETNQHTTVDDPFLLRLLRIRHPPSASLSDKGSAPHEEEKKDLSTELPSKRGTESREPSSSLSRTEELFLSDDEPIESGSAISAPE